ncbi:MAG: HEPN domain-containing protein [Planctomycetes bacterium]|nr:HEPN domain-containing protein [Planctomycetota bacterium]
MNHDFREWIKKAEEDYRASTRLFRFRTEPAYDSVCFHAQQCAEKYLKGVLVAEGKSFPKIHDLRVLLEKLLITHKEWNLLSPDTDLLTEYAVFFRYPGRWADRKLARAAIDACTRIRDCVRLSLGLDSKSSARTETTKKTPRRRTQHSTHRKTGRKKKP